MFQEDLSIFVKDFGQDVIFTLADNTTLTIKAIFDNAFYNPQLGEIDLEITQPRLTCITQDVSTIKKGYTVLVNGKNYEVAQLQSDGTGMTIVVLSDDYS